MKVASQEVQVSDKAGSCNSLPMNVWPVLNSPVAENNAEFEAELSENTLQSQEINPDAIERY